uniref:Putative ovule protein n=1 Tax=Solanum chacoense TaxID=4108 RepID=A0A0V0IXX3_SOLCH
MTTHAIFHDIGEPNQEKKYFNIVSVIFADINQFLSRCKNRHRFFQGCNLLLQWWMSKHLTRRGEKGKQNLGKQDRQDSITSHESCLVFEVSELR